MVLPFRFFGSSLRNERIANFETPSYKLFSRLRASSSVFWRLRAFSGVFERLRASSYMVCLHLISCRRRLPEENAKFSKTLRRRSEDAPFKGVFIRKTRIFGRRSEDALKNAWQLQILGTFFNRSRPRDFKGTRHRAQVRHTRLSLSK